MSSNPKEVQLDTYINVNESLEPVNIDILHPQTALNQPSANLFFSELNDENRSTQLPDSSLLAAEYLPRVNVGCIGLPCGNVPVAILIDDHDIAFRASSSVVVSQIKISG